MNVIVLSDDDDDDRMMYEPPSRELATSNVNSEACSCGGSSALVTGNIDTPDAVKTRKDKLLLQGRGYPLYTPLQQWEYDTDFPLTACHTERSGRKRWDCWQGNLRTTIPSKREDSTLNSLPISMENLLQALQSPGCG
ncbi:hypothetical protein M758_UG079600 [Ceratodon purpureus]|nr:hypothetical protein M758_UG079600 [Ceratodon purpureus]